MQAARRAVPLLVVEHVPWEVPQRIAAAFAGVPLEVWRPLASDARPPRPETIRGAVILGGPMGVNDPLPGLREELRWIERALEQDLPMVGVCLGAQLLATALGATVHRGERWELGWLPVELGDPQDRLLGALGPAATVLHWHRDCCELPSGAKLLASSRDTPCQAFRANSAWGIQFHPEVDRDLVQKWLTVPVMAAQAVAALGEHAAVMLLGGAASFENAVAREMARGFREFAAICRRRGNEATA